MLADGRPSKPNIVRVLLSSEPKEVVSVVRGKANKKLGQSLQVVGEAWK